MWSCLPGSSVGHDPTRLTPVNSRLFTASPVWCRVWHGRRVSGNRFSGARSPWQSIPPGVLDSVPGSNSLRYPGRPFIVSTRMGT